MSFLSNLLNMVGGTQSAEPRTSTDALGPMALEQGATPFQVRSRRGQESALLPTPEVSPLTQTLARLQPYAEPVGEPMLFGIPRYLSSLGVSAQSAFDPQGAQANIDRLLPMLRLERPEQLIGGSDLRSKLGTGFGLASQAASQLSGLDLLRKAGMGLIQGLRNYGGNQVGGAMLDSGEAAANNWQIPGLDNSVLDQTKRQFELMVNATPPDLEGARSLVNSLPIGDLRDQLISNLDMLVRTFATYK